MLSYEIQQENKDQIQVQSDNKTKTIVYKNIALEANKRYAILIRAHIDQVKIFFFLMFSLIYNTGEK